MGDPPAAHPTNPESTMNPHVRRAIEYLKISSRMERKPGFGHALGFSFHHLSADQFRFDGRTTCHIRMPITESLLWKDSASSSQKPAGMLSTLAAIVDEATTLALAVVGRPGVSVMLSMDAGPALRQLRAGDEIEITSFVQKTGRNVGYTKAEIRLVPTGQLVCSGSHIKFLNFGYVGGFLFSSHGWPILKAYCDYVSPTKEALPIPTLTELFLSLESDGNSKATFSASPAHSSLGGPLHGGAQAVLLERAVESVLPLDSDTIFELDSMQMEYLSAPNFQPEIKMTKTFTEIENQMVICAELWSRGKLNSTGIFRYSKEPQTKP